MDAAVVIQTLTGEGRTDDQVVEAVAVEIAGAGGGDAEEISPSRGTDCEHRGRRRVVIDLDLAAAGGAWLTQNEMGLALAGKVPTRLFCLDLTCENEDRGCGEHCDKLIHASHPQVAGRSCSVQDFTSVLRQNSENFAFRNPRIVYHNVLYTHHKETQRLMCQQGSSL